MELVATKCGLVLSGAVAQRVAAKMGHGLAIAIADRCRQSSTRPFKV